MSRLIGLISCFFLCACQSDIYVRDGVTSGNRFHITPEKLLSSDPVVQSWVAYSLSKSLCQLELDEQNPARANSYGCELSARVHLLEEWTLQQANAPELADAYLDTLRHVNDEAFLDEYVAHYFGKQHWNLPAELSLTRFDTWRRVHLAGHKPITRVVGSWSYSDNPTR